MRRASSHTGLRDWEEAHLANAVFDTYTDDPAFGYRFIADELNDAGPTALERRVWRVYCQHAIASQIMCQRCGKASKVGPPVRDDLVQRPFTTDGLNRLW